MMQLIATTDYPVAAGATLTAQIDFNTNSSVIDFDTAKNEIIFKQPGIYKVTAYVVFTATAAGSNTIYGFSSTTSADVPGFTSSFESTVATQTATYSMGKDIRISPAVFGSYSRMNLATLTAGTVENLVVSVEKIR